MCCRSARSSSCSSRRWRRPASWSAGGSPVPPNRTPTHEPTPTTAATAAGRSVLAESRGPTRDRARPGASPRRHNNRVVHVVAVHGPYPRMRDSWRHYFRNSHVRMRYVTVGANICKMVRMKTKAHGAVALYDLGRSYLGRFYN